MCPNEFADDDGKFARMVKDVQTVNTLKFHEFTAKCETGALTTLLGALLLWLDQ